MTPKTTITISLLSMALMFVSAAIAGNALVSLAVLGAFCAGMAVSGALYRIAFPELKSTR